SSWSAPCSPAGGEPDPMPEPLGPALDRLRAELLDPGALVRAVAAGRRRGQPEPDPRRAELRPVDLKEGRRLLVQTWDGTQPTTSHLEHGRGAEDLVDGLLAEPYGSWHVETTEATTQLRVTKKGDAQVHRVEVVRPQDTEHDRRPGRLLEDEAL